MLNVPSAFLNQPSNAPVTLWPVSWFGSSGTVDCALASGAADANTRPATPNANAKPQTFDLETLGSRVCCWRQFISGAPESMIYLRAQPLERAESRTRMRRGGSQNGYSLPTLSVG